MEIFGVEMLEAFGPFRVREPNANQQVQEVLLKCV